MRARFMACILASAALAVRVLRVDRDGLANQLALGLTTGAFVWFFARGSDVPWRQVVCAILVATTGEVVLSLGWGLPSYRHFLIPLYFPPGHDLFYLLAADSARQPILRYPHSTLPRAPPVPWTLQATGSL